MKKEMVEKYKNMLLKLKEKLLQDIGNIEEEHIHSSSILKDGDTYYPQHSADISDREFQTETGFKIKKSEEELLRDINEALKRIDEGIYGICIDCGTKISKDRLKAMPCAIRCITCKNNYEKEKIKY